MGISKKLSSEIQKKLDLDEGQLGLDEGQLGLDEGQLGLVDGMNFDGITQAFEQQEIEDSKAPVEASQPTVTTQPMQPDTWRSDASQQPDTIDEKPIAGTILSEIYQDTNGVYRPDKVESYDDWTARIQKERTEQIRTGFSRFNSPPKDSGFKPYLDVSDGKKPTKEILDVIRKRESIDYCTKELNTLEAEKRRLQIRLQRIAELIKQTKERLESLQ